MNVAICENEKLFCDAIKEYCRTVLFDMGVSCEISTYLSGMEFLASKDMPDMLFLDIEMQGEDGFETAKEVYEQEPDILIVFVTARQEKVKQAFRVRAFRFLEKPVFAGGNQRDPAGSGAPYVKARRCSGEGRRR